MTKKDQIFYNEKTGTVVIDHEKRRQSRILMQRNIVIVLPDESLVLGRIENYSGSGALVLVKANLEKNQIIELKMDEKKLPFARALVIRIAKPGREYGVKWVEFYPDQIPKGLLAREKM